MRESAIKQQILRWVARERSRGVPIKAIKVHGSQYQESGTPDLHVTFFGRSYWIELKRPGGKTTKIQDRRLAEWSSAKAVTGVATSLEEFKAVLYGPEI